MGFVLFLHVLAAFMLAGTTVMMSAVALGATVPDSTVRLSDLLWNVGAGVTLLLGIWLALDEYSILDGWILAAFVLWALAGAAGERAKNEPVPWHWVRAALVVVLLADMIWKPGA